jgi:RNA polymerase sigma factor (TIGR02999 family)
MYRRHQGIWDQAIRECSFAARRAFEQNVHKTIAHCSPATPLAVEWPQPTAWKVTRLLLAWGQGDDAVLGRLVPLVEQELHRIARRCMAGERAGHSLQATALVNEAYLKLIDAQHVKWQDRAHVLAMSARLMRRILVDWARSKGYQKRGGGALKVTFTEVLPNIGRTRP